MKVVLDESGFGMKIFGMKSDFHPNLAELPSITGYAPKFEDRSQEEIGVEIGQEYLQVQRNRHSHILFTYRSVEFAGRIHKITGGNRVCGGLQNKHAYVQQERP